MSISSRLAIGASLRFLFVLVLGAVPAVLGLISVPMLLGVSAGLVLGGLVSDSLDVRHQRRYRF